MHSLQNIWYVTHDTDKQRAGLVKALELAQSNTQALNILVLTPIFPRSLAEHKRQYVQMLSKEIVEQINTLQTQLHTKVEPKIYHADDKHSAIVISQHMVDNNADLVIKEKTASTTAGLSSLDMSLLRKCPCPVWLAADESVNTQKSLNIAVAIDPIDAEDSAEELSISMLKSASQYATINNTHFKIVSCFEYSIEPTLRNNNWLKLTDEQITEEIDSAFTDYEGALNKLITNSGITSNFEICHLRGAASEQIPIFTKENDIDVLFMGTVARTGIVGYFIGNTAENIFQQLDCSLVAFKPSGFVSPIKAK